ncbi:hypothetical protein NPN19_24295, partial [Vibrio parahaemolyticus]|uniref:hypothetical protein n=1 Tax=Vibrio parahaemolyticus TaxID=670 RepID=UPI002113770F
AIAFNMVAAIYLRHASDVLSLSSSGGWGIETPALFLCGALASALIGPGRIAIKLSRSPN